MSCFPRSVSLMSIHKFVMNNFLDGECYYPLPCVQVFPRNQRYRLAKLVVLFYKGIQLCGSLWNGNLIFLVLVVQLRLLKFNHSFVRLLVLPSLSCASTSLGQEYTESHGNDKVQENWAQRYAIFIKENMEKIVKGREGGTARKSQRSHDPEA